MKVLVDTSIWSLSLRRKHPPKNKFVEELKELISEVRVHRSHGIQGSYTDFLICAVAEKHQMSIFTLDQDFENFSKHTPIRFHESREFRK